MSADQRDDPSLLRFVLERLDEEVGLIIQNTPLFIDDRVSPEFHHRFLDRRALFDRTRLDRDVVESCVAVIEKIEGSAPVPAPIGPPNDAVVLASDVIKLVARRFSGHPAYQPHWAPGG